MSRVACLEVLNRLRSADPEYYQVTVEPSLHQFLPPEIIPSADLKRPVENDPTELLRTRFLCRGGTVLLAGPTGIGKSSLTYQCALCWGVGRECFGLTPARPLTTTIIQAENDQGDLAEMRDGVLRGFSWSPNEVGQALEAVHFVCESRSSGADFAPFLQKILEARPSDLVILDPVFAYLGGDASKQATVSPWLRNSLLPVVQETGVGLILVHHTNKPRVGEEKGKWEAGDYAYLGSGSSEFANFCRGVVTLRSLGDDSIFELRAPKRGKRLGWTDTAQFIKHSDEGIYWLQATAEEVETLTGKEGPHKRMLRILQSEDGMAGEQWLKKIVEARPKIYKDRAARIHIRKLQQMGLVDPPISPNAREDLTVHFNLTENGKSLLGIDI